MLDMNSEFISKWCLTLSNAEAEGEFKKRSLEKLLKFNPLVAISTFTVALANTVFQVFMRESLFEDNISWACTAGYISHTVTLISFICIILAFACKHRTLQKILNYTNYILIVFPFSLVRQVLIASNHLEQNNWLSVILYLTEYFLRILWIFNILLVYREVLILNTIIIFTLLCISLNVTNKLDITAFNVSYDLFLIFVIFISYFYTKQVKINFYSNFTLSKKNEWFSSILENLNSGVFYLKNKKINYVNKIMYEKMQGNKEICNIFGHSSMVNNTERENNILIQTEGCFVNSVYANNFPTLDEFMQIVNSPKISEKILDVLLSDIFCGNLSKQNISKQNSSKQNLNVSKQILFKQNCLPNLKEENLYNSNFTANNNNNNLKLNVQQSIVEDRNNFITSINNNNNENIEFARLPTHTNNSDKKFSSKVFLDDLKKLIYSSNDNNYIPNLEKFVLLGYKNLEIETEENGEMKKELINFEIFYRLQITADSKKEECENIELIFNDVTRATDIEERNAEFRYKSLFLAKIAHEFKNPLICITELVEQIKDTLQEKKLEIGKFNNQFKSSVSLHNNNDVMQDSIINNNLKKNLPLISALSNYMLILVKDLDFFSKSQLSSSKDTKNELGDADLKEIFEFCSQISKGLLKKNNKENDIELIISKSNNVPECIWTDETKLKQILINLLSNAIKFTNKGKINVDVSKVDHYHDNNQDIDKIHEEEELLKFNISDTGSGMTNEMKSNLFKPYKKSNGKNNKIGAGLGLSICSDLVKQLGGNLDYWSRLNEGTTFYFVIPYKQPYGCGCKCEKQNENITDMLLNSNRIISKNNSNSSSDLMREINLQEKGLHPKATNKFRAVSNVSVNSFAKSSMSLVSKDTVVMNQLQLNIPEKYRSNYSNKISDKSSLKKKNNRFYSSDSCNIYINKYKQYFFSPIQHIKKQQNIHSIDKPDDNDIDDNDEEGSYSRFDDIIDVSNINCNLKKLSNRNLYQALNTLTEEPAVKEFEDNSAFNFIIADDESLARQSTIRNFRKAASKSKKKINILESEDGIETLYIVYRSILKGIKISGIITDETMKILKGSNCAEVIKNLFEVKSGIPIYLVSAYEDKSVINNAEYFREIFSKPLEIKSAEKIINLAYL